MQPPAHTIDAFHRGGFFLAQPKGAGHRAGMDALMLAAAVPSDFSGTLADFGSGAGAAGLAVASRCAGATITLVERSSKMAQFAMATLALPQNAHLAGRASLLTADVTLSGTSRQAAGLADNSFDFVIMNPPFNAKQDRQTPDGLKKSAHVMEDELFERWVRSAAAVLRPKGHLTIIARPVSLVPLLAAFGKRFGNAEIVPVHPRADAAAIRIILRARRGARGALSLCPPLVLHEDDGRFTARAEAISDGKASLFND